MRLFDSASRLGPPPEKAQETSHRIFSALDPLVSERPSAAVVPRTFPSPRHNRPDSDTGRRRDPPEQSRRHSVQMERPAREDIYHQYPGGGCTGMYTAPVLA